MRFHAVYPTAFARARLAMHFGVMLLAATLMRRYLRGQWTVHRNRRDISTIWQACPHLGDELQKELLMKVAWVRRMESRGAGAPNGSRAPE